MTLEPSLILLVHALATISMAGLIWFVQVVHYPMFAYVGAERFVEYERIHQQRTTWVVAPLMLAEVACALWLAMQPPAGVAHAVMTVNLLLLAIIWLSTLFLQVPSHRLLEHGFDELRARVLVRTNWIRTVAWSGRSICALVMIMQGTAS